MLRHSYKNLGILSARYFTTVRPSCPLYLHDTGDKVAVSFSKNPKAVPIGCYSKQYQTMFRDAIDSDPNNFDAQPVVQKPDLFEENPRFWQIAGKALQQNIHSCPIFKALAEAEDKSVFYHIYDLRNPPVMGRIPEVDDILGTVQINQGSIVAGSMECNTMYRPVSLYGVMVVSDEMREAIVKAVETDS